MHVRPHSLVRSSSRYAAWNGPPPAIGWRDVWGAAARWVQAHPRAFVWIGAHEAHMWLKPSEARYASVSAAWPELAQPQRVYAAVTPDLEPSPGHYPRDGSHSYRTFHDLP